MFVIIGFQDIYSRVSKRPNAHIPSLVTGIKAIRENSHEKIDRQNENDHLSGETHSHENTVHSDQTIVGEARTAKSIHNCQYSAQKRSCLIACDSATKVVPLFATKCDVAESQAIRQCAEMTTCI